MSTVNSPKPWSELKMLQQEIRWANEMLDFYGAPRTHYNPYTSENYELNLAGRISVWLNPKNEGGWTVNNPEVKEILEKNHEQ